MDKDYTVAEDAIKSRVRHYAAGKNLDANLPVEQRSAPVALQVDDVTIEGAPPATPSGRRGFVQMIDSPTGDPTERLDVRLKLHLNPKDDTSGALETDLRASNHEQVTGGVVKAMKDLFSKIELPEALGGGKLSDHYDWSNKTPEEAKPFKEQLADLEAQVKKGIEQAEQAGNPIPPAVADLLKHSKTFDAENGTVFGWDSSKPSADEGRVSVNFSVPKKGEGNESNSASVRDNILAREAEILEAIKAKAREKGVSEEALSQLALHVTSSENEWGSNVNVTIGSKLKEPAKEGQLHHVDPNALSSLSQENLNRIVKDSILLEGKGAAEVAHLVAGDGDVRHFLELYKDKAPEFAKALDESPVLKNAMPWQEREEFEKKQKDTKLIPPVVTLLTGHNDNGTLQNDIQLAIDLPKNVTHDMVVNALEGKPIVLGDQTEKLLKQKIENKLEAAAGVNQAQVA